MCLSYGEVACIEEMWEDWKKEHGGDGSPESAYEFIEKECAEVYPSEEEQDEIFAEIGCLEERCA